MKIIRSNLSPGMIVLLIVLAVLFAFIVVPILLIVGFCWLVCNIITGSSPAELYLRRKARRRDRNYEGPYARDAMEDGNNDPDAGSPDDDTIECEVISARTVEHEQDDREIR